MVVTRRKKPEIAGDDATTPNASVKEDAAAAGAEEACVEVKGDEGHRAAKRAKHTTDKFAHLLEPIRDIAENWSVDIATELEEYLEELEGITFDVPHNGSAQQAPPSASSEPRDGEPQTKFSFAKAALLIQGSTYVYSKKVEYLFALVTDALNKVLGKKGAFSKRGDAERRLKSQADEDLFLLEGNEDAYLNLDDAVDQGTANIDLAPEDAHDVGGAADPLDASIEHTALMMAMQNQAKAAPGGPGDEKLSKINLSSFAVHSSGALLLDGADEAALNDDLQPIDGAAGMVDAAMHDAAGAPDADPALDLDLDAPPMDGGLSDGEDGGAFAPDPTSPHTPHGDAADFDEEDPYELLDLDSAGRWDPKPIKRGRLQVKWKSMAGGKDGMWGIPERLEEEAHADAEGEGEGEGEEAGPTFPEFRVLFRQAKAREGRRALRRAREAERRHANPHPHPNATHAHAHEQRQTHGVLRHEADHPEDGDDYALMADLGDMPPPEIEIDYASMSEQEDNTVNYEAYDRAADMLEHAGARTRVRGEGAWEDAGADADADGGAGAGESYEEVCKAHVERLYAAAAAQEQHTALAARVSAWKGKVEPAIEESNAHPSFDIHAYGESVVARMQKREQEMEARRGEEGEEEGEGEGEGGAHAFGHLVSSNPKFEICRVFAAILQLVNDGNVGLSTSDDGQLAVTLEASTFRHKQLPRYRAPSVLADASGMKNRPSLPPSPSLKPHPGKERRPGRGEKGKGAPPAKKQRVDSAQGQENQAPPPPARVL